jgi:hypothetical protein
MKDNLALSDVIKRNFRKIIHLRAKPVHERGLGGRAADAITSFSGRMVFAFANMFCFADGMPRGAGSAYRPAYRA